MGSSEGAPYRCLFRKRERELAVLGTLAVFLA